MRLLITITLILATVFGSTFFIMVYSGILTVESIESWLYEAAQFNKYYLSLCIIILLFADLFVAIPTMTVCLLSGFLLGFPLGFVSALLGTMTAGITGYLISKKYGRSLLRKTFKDTIKISEMEKLFHEKGVIVILLCRAMPMLPEISCCLAGANNMRFGKFIFLFSIATMPYALITTIAGGYSTIEDPKPAIYAAIAISLTLWGTWYMLLRKTNVLKVEN